MGKYNSGGGKKQNKTGLKAKFPEPEMTKLGHPVTRNITTYLKVKSGILWQERQEPADLAGDGWRPDSIQRNGQPDAEETWKSS